MILKTITTLTEPKFLTPIVSILLSLPVKGIASGLLIIASLVAAIVGGYYEIKDDKLDTFEFEINEMREKRYFILSIGIIYFGIVAVLDINQLSNYWSAATFILISIFLSLTILFKERFSAHTLFLFINFGGLFLISRSIIVLIALFFLIAIIGYWRISIKKHNLKQIIFSIIFCVPYLFFIIK